MAADAFARRLRFAAELAANGIDPGLCADLAQREDRGGRVPGELPLIAEAAKTYAGTLPATFRATSADDQQLGAQLYQLREELTAQRERDAAPQRADVASQLAARGFAV
ncbi:hypothetical protein [Longimicrobium sp.]|jgi:hypothetical protein|uniref:hypothetical protein n=1 Tax=Longimicrobium sp. TaxID=2029185 RepID=UPI002F92AC87